jgi:sugar phosphate isomerase/epimerase
MKLAVSTYSLARWQPTRRVSLKRQIDRIAQFGVQGIEFAGSPIPTKQNARAMRQHCERVGLEVAGFCVGAELLAPKAQQRLAVAQLKRDVDIAEALGCQSMRHDVTRGFEAYKRYRGPKTFSRALKIISPAIREVADYAADRGITTTLENHGFYMQASKRVVKLIETVNHDNFALTMDMGNFLCVNENPVEAARRAVKKAVMVHTKDFHVRSKMNMPPTGWFATPTPIALRGAIVGHGAIDIPAQLRILQRANYRGFLSLEFEGIEEPAFAIEQGLNYLRQQLKAIKAIN